ncbi:MAG: hypothetical protein AAF673_00865 [Pseudomonadota bacterium]
MSKVKEIEASKEMEASKKKFGVSDPIPIKSRNKKLGEKIKLDDEFIIGSYNPDKHKSFLGQILNSQEKPSEFFLLGENFNDGGCLEETFSIEINDTQIEQ